MVETPLQTLVPSYVDTRKVFLQQENISGSIGLERLPRFRDCLIDDEASIQLQLSFSITASSQQVITGTLQASVHVSCQRCLEPLAIELADDIRLALVKTEAAVEGLDAGWDSWICPDHKLELAELVEEQLMLCLPIASMHESGDCLARVNYSAVATAGDGAATTKKEVSQNPFSVLKELKENNVTD